MGVGLASSLTLLAITILFATGCDPGTELVLRVDNTTDRLVRVLIPTIVSSRDGPPYEIRGIDAVLGAREVRELAVLNHGTCCA